MSFLGPSTATTQPYGSKSSMGLKSNAKDYAIMGSMALPYILKGLQNNQYTLNNPVSLTIVESSYTKLAASLCLYDYSTLVEECKKNNIGLHLILGEDFVSLREQTSKFACNFLDTRPRKCM